MSGVDFPCCITYTRMLFCVSDLYHIAQSVLCCADFALSCMMVVKGELTHRNTTYEGMGILKLYDLRRWVVLSAYLSGGEWWGGGCTVLDICQAISWFQFLLRCARRLQVVPNCVMCLTWWLYVGWGAWIWVLTSINSKWDHMLATWPSVAVQWIDCKKISNLQMLS